MKPTIICKGNRSVIINVQGRKPNRLVWATLYVSDCITLTRWEGKTLAGAIKWANRILSRR